MRADETTQKFRVIQRLMSTMPETEVDHNIPRAVFARHLIR